MVEIVQLNSGFRGRWPLRARTWLFGRPLAKQLSNLFLSSPKPASIFGDDDRTVNIDTSPIPQRLIVSLTIYSREGGRFYGSGWLAAPRMVITCGHCVFDEQLHGFAESIEIVPGLTGTDDPFGTFKSSHFEAHPAWKESADRSFDIGCIFLSESAGDGLGYFSTGKIESADTLTDENVLCAGYPIFDGGHSYQLSGEGQVKDVIGTRLFHDADTLNGTSGGPVWLKNDDQSPPTVVAVHSYEEGEIPGRPGEFANSATLISSEISEMIEEWLKTAI